MLGSISATQCARAPILANVQSHVLDAKPVVSSYVTRMRRNIIPTRSRSLRPIASSSTGESSTERFFQQGAEGAAREELFSTISPVYDELNDQLSFGMHKVWKRMTVKWSGAAPGCAALDVCCGSGDIALILAEVVGRTGSVVGLDFSGPMLTDAALREASKRESNGGAAAPTVQWIQGDAMDLPFEDATFDAATMGYGLRNVADIPKALHELHRVLRPGCRAAILDFNNSEDGIVDTAQEWFLENLVVPAADAKGVGDEYRYLRPSIKNFPKGKEQERLALEAGFSKAKHFEIGFGLMGVLVVAKSM